MEYEIKWIKISDNILKFFLFQVTPERYGNSLKSYIFQKEVIMGYLIFYNPNIVKE